MAIVSQKKRRHLLKPSRLVFLIVLLASNTFAWFIYATKIDSSVSVHVRAWNIVFQNGENEISNEIAINVDSIYPGMDDFEYNVTAYNRSEVSAGLSYQILSARILDQEYVSIEQKSALGLSIEEDDLTSAEIEEILLNNYPFSISISTSNNVINQVNGEEEYSFSVSWPYENDNDEADTLWGTSAYEYRQNYPSNPSISLNVKVVITQNAN